MSDKSSKTLNRQNTEPKSENKAVKKQNQALIVFKRLIQRPTAVIGMVIVAVLLFVAIFAEVLTPYDYTKIDVLNANLSPSLAHPAGTDSVGRDILARLMMGTRYSLTLGVCSTLLGTLLGCIVGCVAGFFGGTVDEVIMRLCDVIQSIPGMVLNVAVACAIGTGFWNCILVLSIGGIAGNARMLRANILKIRDMEYVEAAEVVNCSNVKIMVKHLVPNAFAPMIVGMSMGIGGQIMAASGLAYLGLGVSQPTPEWGAMLSDGRNYLTKYPWMCIFPGVLIMITVLAANLLGDGLRDALDPKLKK